MKEAENVFFSHCWEYGFEHVWGFQVTRHFRQRRSEPIVTCRPGPKRFWFDYSTSCDKLYVVGVSQKA